MLQICVWGGAHHGRGVVRIYNVNIICTDTSGYRYFAYNSKSTTATKKLKKNQLAHGVKFYVYLITTTILKKHMVLQ